MRAHHRPIAGVTLGGILALLLIVGVSAAAAAKAGSRAARAVKISASLSEAAFAPNETDSVRLLYSFPSKSSGFSWALALKKGSNWQTLKFVSSSRSFRGNYSMLVAKLFPRKKVALGSYRLRLNSGSWRTTLNFNVVKALSTTTVSIGAAEAHSCALVSGGRVKCWGDNGFGELGNRSTTDSITPVAAKNIVNATALTTGGFTSCALMPGGKIRCWGDNAYGKLGIGSMSPSASSLPLSVSGMAHAVAVSSGADHSCALMAGGAIKCWGRNVSGDTGSSKSFNTIPAGVGGITGAIAVSAGYRHSCALLSGGKVVCWGNNHFGQLGNGKTTSNRKPVAVKGIKKALSVSAGNDSSCAVLSDHTIKCWGRAEGGALGDGLASHGHKDSAGIDFKPTPVSVKGLSNAASVSAGGGFSCARLSTKQVKCWGTNSSGQLGDSATDDSSTPVAVSGISTAVAISASAGAVDKGHACALVSGSKVKCWGKNDAGQLGSSAQTYSATPLADSIVNATKVTAGEAFGCALLAGGTVDCWGSNSSGELGIGTVTASLTPVAVKDAAGTGKLSGVTALSSGYQHSCALLSGGTVDCWGSNASGELGDGTTSARSLPVAVKGIGGVGELSGVTALSVGNKHSCALLSSGAVNCWGSNSNGQLGDGTTTSSLTSIAVKGVGGTGELSGVSALSAGFQHICALLTGATVNCWGSNSSGQLGDGTTTDRSTPVAVKGVGATTALSGVTALSTGRQHSCARLSGGAIDCWGSNSNGELGVGLIDYSSAPVEVVGLP
jgi:alpha-tubulin suppressor-like RCC1 family protein